MLQALGLNSLEELVDRTLPRSIRTERELKLPPAKSEFELLKELRAISLTNKVFKNYIGAGYYGSITPPVIQRNVLENPGWYTQYTPYQAEISQGRLECLLNFQTMVMDLTGLDIANASLLDEATAAAEAMYLAYQAKGSDAKNVFFVSELCHPQNIEVVVTRAQPLGIRVVVGNHERLSELQGCFGVLLQYPATDGQLINYKPAIEQAHAMDALAIVATDLLALTLIQSPGELGADVAVGSAQRFGVPLGYGGPHAAFFATRDAFKRQMPGRLIGVSRDAQGRPAYRLSLQTREQHIRREKATSNICTAQALLANMAALYAIYHGPEGLRGIATYVHKLARVLAKGLQDLGITVVHNDYFDTIRIETKNASDIIRSAEAQGINLRQLSTTALSISVDETTTPQDVEQLWSLFSAGAKVRTRPEELALSLPATVAAAFERKSSYLQAPVFRQYHSETEMLRYIRLLESRDLSLTTSMIPLGSCTMKLNATAEMFPVSWPEFSLLHPFAPREQTKGYEVLFRQLSDWLAEITGFDAVSLQPNAGSQGEYAGLLAIHAYHAANGHTERDICLIPTSAHGTNPASAALAGLQVVAVACDADGNVQVDDLRKKAGEHKDRLACLMVTYPSTHGVFEESIKEACKIVHENGGQVYMDGANLNAQVGLCRPAELGADVCHINLHKTFCIPHGGGGPGMGPICVGSHLAPYLPGHQVVSPDPKAKGGAVSAAPWGSASILTISWMYIGMMGAAGLKRATQVAILNANYIAHRLKDYFPVLYKGKNGMVAHECILDFRGFKSVSVEDVAKRLMDYSFHAPTMSFPVPGTLMVEPTESESKEELDRFCEAMISIHAEIKAVESGKVDKANNVLKNAPHTADVLISEKWDRPYPREQAAYPAPWLRRQKFWPSVGRIDNVFGDRNLVCSCVGMDAYMSAPEAAGKA